MPIENVIQPEILPVDDTLRLRRFDGEYAFALPWYQDADTVWLVDGAQEPYDMDQLGRMYRYLDAHGELYWIEVRQGDTFRPVGDVTFWQEDMPIVIGDKSLRGQGIGGRVIAALIDRARQLSYRELLVSDIYDWNMASRRCFERAGFRTHEKTEKGSSYRLVLA